MTLAPVSVVIVSRHRPDALRRCLLALEFQTYLPFEVVVVGDTPPAETNRTKYVPFDTPNISAARNLGIAQAAGDIAAFIDDDAIAEPTWLARLAAAFDDAEVAAAGGFVRGRNGISFQWKAEEICSDGTSLPLDVIEPTTLAVSSDRVVKLQGTNCAFRSQILRDLGGFDEGFRFFHDEADLCFRIAQAGHKVAIVPAAEVQHGYAPSAFRGSDRRPRSLYEIGASQALFLRKHAKLGTSVETFRQEQFERLDRALVQGALEPRDVRRLRAELEAGFIDGAKREEQLVSTWSTPPPFVQFRTDSVVGPHRFIKTRRSKKQRAFASVESGQPSTVISLSVTSLFHRRYFHDSGFWVQSGGIFGKSTRSDPYFRWYSFVERHKREQDMLEKTR